MKIDTDVLVIGGGGAAARAAIEATKNVDKVSLVVKGKLPSGSTIASMAFMSTIVREDDNIDLYYEDTMKGGYNLNNSELVRILAEEAKTACEDLVKFGTEFKASRKGALYVVQPSGMSRGRSIGALNHQFMKGLVAEVRKSKIEVIENIMITDLLKQDNRVIGAVGFNYKNGQFISISSKAIILATGGLGQIYQNTSMPISATGDGYAMAFRIGAELIDMEFTQAMTCVIYPHEIRGLAPPFDGLVRFGAKFFNGLNERYMEKYEPEKVDNVTRDIACICGYKEIIGGRATQHGGLIMDISKLPWKAIKNVMPKIYNAYDRLGIDATKTGIEWAPGCHHEMGGLRVNSFCESNIEGLFAAGEVIGGVHGANRLGGNSLTATQVFGKIAGRSASKYAKSIPQHQISTDIIEEKKKEIFDIHTREQGISYLDVREKLREIMSKNVWIIKTKEKLNSALIEITKLQEGTRDSLKLPEKSYKYLKEAKETLNMLEVGEILIYASLLRTESRGAHYREDYPKQDDKNWLKNIVIQKEQEKITWKLVAVKDQVVDILPKVD